MAILYMPKPMLLEDLDLWVKPDSRRYAQSTVETLQKERAII